MRPPRNSRREPSPAARSGGTREFDLGFARICQALKVRTQLALASMLGIHQSSISEARRRGVIPVPWAIKLFRKYRLNPLWVYDGLPPVFITASPERPTLTEARPPDSFLSKYPQGQMATMTIRDRAMEPLIREAAYVGLCLAQRDIESGQIYGLDLPMEGLALRRVVLSQDETQAWLLAENPLIPPQHLPVDEAARRVVGRVVWVMMAP
jgi:hypothetical protein